MDIIEKRLDELKPYENNPRKNDRAVSSVAESIKAFGWKQPIVIDKNNVIVCGHTRYKAAKRLKLKYAPCVIADDLTEDEIKAYRIADNIGASKSEWDFGKLEIELPEIDMDMSVFGLDFLDNDEAPKETQEDNFEEEIPTEAKSKRGDIYQLGDHRLMCGDSTSKEDVDVLLGGGTW